MAKATKVTAAQIKATNEFEVTLTNGLEVMIEFNTDHGDYTVTVEELGETSDHENVKSVNAELKIYEVKSASEVKGDKVELADMRKAADEFTEPETRPVYDTFIWWDHNVPCDLSAGQYNKLNAVLEHMTTVGDDEKVEKFVIHNPDENGFVVVEVLTQFHDYKWRFGKRGGFDSMDGLGRWFDGKAAWDMNLQVNENGIFCRNCNKVLTDPISIALGIGPECADKLGIKYAMPKDEDDE